MNDDLREPNTPRETIQELLVPYVLGEVSSAEKHEVDSTLEQDPQLRVELEELKKVLLGLHFSAGEVEPLEGHKERFVTKLQRSASEPTPIPSNSRIPSVQRIPRSSARVRRSPLPWLPVGMGIAVAMGAMTLLRSEPAPGLVNVAPDAAVVVSSGDSLVFANNVQGQYPIVVRDRDGKMRPVEVGRMGKNYWFTEGVAENGKVYLSCGANHMILVVDVAKATVTRIEKAPSSVAGLSVTNGKLWMKGAANGQLETLENKNENKKVQTREIGKAAEMPMADFMDAVLPLEKTVWVTHHANGELITLNAKTLEVERRIALGGAPVALDRWNSQIIVADVSGRILWLSESGKLERTLKLEGKPDKLAVQGDFAYLSDRSGKVFQVNLKTATLERTVQFTHPMDIAALPDGHLALADGPGGVLMLDRDLKVLERIGGS